MDDALERLSLARHRDGGRRGSLWARRIGLVVIVAVLALALAGVFGQASVTSRATGDGASLALDAPRTVRGGLLFEAEFVVRAERRVARPRLVLERNWLDGLTINTQTSQAEAEASRDGGLVLAFGELPAGDELTVRIAYQVNPTTVGRRGADVALLDGGRPLAAIDHHLTVLP